MVQPVKQNGTRPCDGKSFPRSGFSIEISWSETELSSLRELIGFWLRFLGSCRIRWRRDNDRGADDIAVTRADDQICAVYAHPDLFPLSGFAFASGYVADV